MRILVTEDSAACGLLHLELRELGHDVQSVTDGAAAWSACLGEHYQMAILGRPAPGPEGLEPCRRLKHLGAEREPFVLVEAGDDTSELAAILQAGADDVITAPVTCETLRARVRVAERRIERDSSRRGVERDGAAAQPPEGATDAVRRMEHEINNPLSALLAILSFAREVDSLEEYQESTDAALTQTRRVAAVVRRLSSLPDSHTRVPG